MDLANLIITLLPPLMLFALRRWTHRPRFKGEYTVFIWYLSLLLLGALAIYPIRQSVGVARPGAFLEKHRYVAVLDAEAGPAGQSMEPALIQIRAGQTSSAEYRRQGIRAAETSMIRGSRAYRVDWIERNGERIVLDSGPQFLRWGRPATLLDREGLEWQVHLRR